MTVRVAPGFFDLEYAFSKRVTAIGWQVITDAVTQSAQIHSEQLNRMLGFWARAIDPTRPQIKFRLPVLVEMQMLQGEDDSPVAVRGFDEYQIGFPLYDVGLAWGNNRKSRAKMTVGDANQFTLNMLQADSRWQRGQMFRALLNNVQYVYEDKGIGGIGDITVKPLANGDTDRYHRTDGETDVDNHYHAQADAIDATHSPFEDIFEDLTEHPANQGNEILSFVPRGLVKSVQALPDFIPFAMNGRVRNSTSQDVLTDFPDVPFGDRPLGLLQDSGVYVKEWRALTAKYIISVPVDNAEEVLGWRDEPEAELQGLRPEVATYDGNHVVERGLRTRGFAVRNRVGARVDLIGAAVDDVYEVPANFLVPGQDDPEE
ncbi:MAG TPA: hypothetical protein PKD09_09220 [Aggregatilinea sp.]|uniref:hypothetical protein n=1 Tax=Aggregatilinea sp. TaxID=2806333 RepID=UPI002C017F06|nr:hypothetical protein [Aggregatilinea sp.]HML21816.1 hypothetical protein [Aggregatilinea sp.]